MHSIFRSDLCFTYLSVMAVSAWMGIASPVAGQLTESVDASLVPHDAFLAVSISPSNLSEAGRQIAEHDAALQEDLDLIHRAFRDRYQIELDNLETVLLTVGFGPQDPQHPSMVVYEHFTVLRFHEPYDQSRLSLALLGDEPETVKVNGQSCLRRPGAFTLFCFVDESTIVAGSARCLGKVFAAQADHEPARELVGRLALDAEFALSYQRPTNVSRPGQIMLSAIDELGLRVSEVIWPRDRRGFETIDEVDSIELMLRSTDSIALELECVVPGDEARIEFSRRVREIVSHGKLNLVFVERELDNYPKAIRDALRPVVGTARTFLKEVQIEQTEIGLSLIAEREDGIPEIVTAIVRRMAADLKRNDGILPAPPGRNLNR